MKRIIAVLVSLIFAMSFCIFPAYAYGGGEEKYFFASSHKEFKGNVDESNVNMDELYNNLNMLREQFKVYYKDMNKRKELLKKIKTLKQQLDKIEKKTDKAGKKIASNLMLCFVNGEELASDVPPVIKDGRTLVPVRALTTALGADVKWNPETHVVTITKNGMTIELKLGSDIVTVNGKEMKIDVPAENLNNRVVVPIRFIAEIFHQKVEWDEDTGSIIIGNNDKDENNNDNEDDKDNKAFEKVTVNDNTTGTADNQFEYVGNWNYGYQTGAYQNDNHWAVTADVYYQVRFAGTQIKVFGAKDPGFGIAAVSIDGSAETSIDCYAPTRSDNVPLYISPVLQNGQHILKVRVTGSKDSKSGGICINADRVVIYAPAVSANLALGKQAAASSCYDADTGAEKAFDGRSDTRWSSQFSDAQWISVDLGSTQSISKVVLKWEAAYGKAYKIQVSGNASDWTDVYSTTNGDGGTDTITFSPVNARFVRMYGIQRGTDYGYSLWEFEVYAR